MPSVLTRARVPAGECREMVRVSVGSTRADRMAGTWEAPAAELDGGLARPPETKYSPTWRCREGPGVGDWRLVERTQRPTGRPRGPAWAGQCAPPARGS